MASVVLTIGFIGNGEVAGLRLILSIEVDSSGWLGVDVVGKSFCLGNSMQKSRVWRKRDDFGNYVLVKTLLFRIWTF